MSNIDVAPMLFEVLGHEPAMAMVRPVLTAQQAAICNHILDDRFFDATLLHQVEETRLVRLPVPAFFLVLVQHFLGGCPQISFRK